MKHYTGAGRYALGVPARALSDEEWDALTDDERDRATSLYEHVDGPIPDDTPPTETPKPRRGSK